jgi:hypothetical protein
MAVILDFVFIFRTPFFCWYTSGSLYTWPNSRTSTLPGTFVTTSWVSICLFYITSDSLLLTERFSARSCAPSVTQKTPRRIGQPGSFEPGQVGSLLPGQVTRWCCTASATASVRLVTPSLERMLLT